DRCRRDSGEPLAGRRFEILVVLRERAAMDPDDDRNAGLALRQIQIELVEVVRVLRARQVRNVLDDFDRYVGRRERERPEQEYDGQRPHRADYTYRAR